MNHLIAHTDDLLPGNMVVSVAQFLRDFARGLADNFDIPDYGVNGFIIQNKIIRLHVSGVSLNIFYGINDVDEIDLNAAI